MLLCRAYADSAAGDPTVGAAILAVIFVGALISLAHDRRRHPHLPCRDCGGTGRHFSAWRPKASGRCQTCGGKAVRRRRGSGVQ